MDIKFYGHACISVQDRNFSIAFDPWFSKSGAFLASWFQFPDNTDLDLEPVRNSDFVVLTHEHQDHVDLNFLKTLNRKTRICIPKFTDSYLYDLLKSHLTNEILVFDTREKVSLAPGFQVCLVTQSIPIWDDASIILETPDGTILDVNDMKVTTQDMEWIKQNFRVKYLFMQFAPSAWHPYVYDYSDSRKASILRHKTLTRFGFAKDTFFASGAERFIPSAGPPCFLDSSQIENMFLDDYVSCALPKFYSYARENGFAEKINILLPGEALDLFADYSAVNEIKLRSDAYANTRTYLEQYKERRKAQIDCDLQKIESPIASLLEKCKQHFEPLIASSPYFRMKINQRLLLDVKGPVSEKIVIDFTKDANQVYRHNGEDIFWTFEMESKFLNQILEGKMIWEELLLSRRIRASRNPDIYNEFLIVFLRFRDRNSFKAYEEWDRKKSREEYFDLTFENRTYKIQRYCPHARGDLSKGRVVNGELVCPGHGWTFSLVDGKCSQNSCFIRIDELQQS